MSRTLVWYVEQIVGDGTEQGPVFIVERDYTPAALRVNVKKAPDAGDMTFTVRDDGASILTRSARVLKNTEAESAADDWGTAPAVIAEGSLVSLDIVANGAKGITVELDLDD